MSLHVINSLKKLKQRYDSQILGLSNSITRDCRLSSMTDLTTEQWATLQDRHTEMYTLIRVSTDLDMIIKGEVK